MRNNVQNMLNMKPRQTMMVHTPLRSGDNRSINGFERIGFSPGVLDSFPSRTAQERHAVAESFALEAAAFRGPPSVLNLYLREIGHLKQLSREEETALAGRIQAGDEAARELMIKSNLRLVVKIARNYENMGLALLDLISEGNIGLMKAVEHFDPAKGAKLSVYAPYWIRAYICRALSNHSRTIRVPEHVHTKLHTVNAAAARLQKLLGRDPTSDEIAQETGLSAVRVQRMREATQATISLDAPLSDSDERPIAEVVAEETSTTPEEAYADSATVQHLREFFRQLNPREQSILRFRFGLGCPEEKTLEEIGRQFGLSRERIRQIQDNALQKLRKKFKAQKLLLLAARCAMCH